MVYKQPTSVISDSKIGPRTFIAKPIIERCTSGIHSKTCSFLISLNDFNECPNYSNVIQFADDTISNVSGKITTEIEKPLNTDFVSVFAYHEITR